MRSFWNYSIFIKNSIASTACVVKVTWAWLAAISQTCLFQPIFIRPIGYHNPLVLVILNLYRQWLVDSIDFSFWSKMGLEHTYCWEEIWAIFYGTIDEKRF